MRQITVGVVAPAYVSVPLWVAQRRGQAISDPDPDLAKFARSLGLQAASQVRERAALPAALADAVAAVRSGQCVLVDVRVRPDGYATSSG